MGNLKMLCQKVAILGVGLLGASFASALRETWAVETVNGYGRSESNLIYAREQGIIDNYSMDAAEVCYGADLILLALPVGCFIETARHIAPAIRQGALVTDTGSIKGSLVYTLEEIMPTGVIYVGSHPIAGSHDSGVRHSDKRLFQDALCIITPTKNSSEEATGQISSLWSSIGSRVVYMDPYEHDEIYNLVSHFPHLLAYCLVNSVKKTKEGAIGFAGKGFKDMTRIAASSPDIWADIIMMNRDNIASSIDAFNEELSVIKKWLRDDDRTSIERYLRNAQDIRRGI